MCLDTEKICTLRPLYLNICSSQPASPTVQASLCELISSPRAPPTPSKPFLFQFLVHCQEQSLPFPYKPAEKCSPLQIQRSWSGWACRTILGNSAQLHSCRARGNQERKMCVCTHTQEKVSDFKDKNFAKNLEVGPCKSPQPMGFDGPKSRGAEI